MRLHSAEHGAWPQSLTDVTVAPIPLDPATNKPFDYSVAAGVATLSATKYRLGSYPFFSVRYELTLKPAVGN